MLVVNGIFLALRELAKSWPEPIESNQINAVLSGIVTVSAVYRVTVAEVIVGWVGNDC